MLPLLKKRPQAAAAQASPAKPGLPPSAVVQRALIDTQDFEAGEPWRANADVFSPASGCPGTPPAASDKLPLRPWTFS